MLIGLHARDDLRFVPADFAIIQQAKIESLKTMGFTHIDDYHHVRVINPDLQFIVRLHHKATLGGPEVGGMPSPQDFVAFNNPIISKLHNDLGIQKFEIHNEPNLKGGGEGWGDSNEDAEKFKIWYGEVLKGFRNHHKGLLFGFPGLALLQNDLGWLDICKSVIEDSNWLGCHVYWQTPGGQEMWKNDTFGLRFKAYHNRFPDMPIEITEYGNSNLQSDIPLDRQDQANQYVDWIQNQVRPHSYIESVHAFISTSPHKAFKDDQFEWATGDGNDFTLHPVVGAMAGILRPAL